MYLALEIKHKLICSSEDVKLSDAYHVVSGGNAVSLTGGRRGVSVLLICIVSCEMSLVMVVL